MKKFFSILFLTGAVLFAAPHLQAKEKEESGVVHIADIKGVISPATYALVKREIARAEKANAEALIFEMHTPGGLYDSTQQIVQAILDSKVPVVTYVSPSGSHAASAGTYILYASHIAAMAPSTNLGAATPVQMGENKKKEDESALDRKMVNDASAYIRGLAELRGRNAEWAEKAVRDAESLTSSEALSKKVIDMVADDIESLLRKMDGKTVKMAHGKTYTLQTKDARAEKFEPDWMHTLLEIITHPNVALLLMSLGSYGLIYEFANPGALFPGIMGAICLLLGLYAMNVLPVSYSGLALVFLGLILMAAEAFTPTFGVLGLGGAAAFIFGSAMLIQSDVPGLQVDWWMIAAMTGTSLLFLTLILGLVVSSHRKPKTTGVEEILSSIAVVQNWSGSEGTVHLTGEVWKAFSTGPYILQKGDQVRIVEIDGLRVKIMPV